MIFRSISALFCTFAVWAASLQLNDPDPERWVAMYLACAWVALLGALDKPAPKQALAVALLAFGWSLAIVPEVWGKWQPRDLTATMSGAHPEIEYGRELFGLWIVAGYCELAFLVFRARAGKRSD